MIDTTLQSLALLAATAIIMGHLRRLRREWAAGKIGAARIGVSFAAVLIAAAAGGLVTKFLVPGNEPAAITIWILGGWAIGVGWARLDGMLEAWERTP